MHLRKTCFKIYFKILLPIKEFLISLIYSKIDRIINYLINSNLTIIDKFIHCRNKYSAKKYFKIGNLYKFANSQIWYTLWADKERTKQILRIKPGSIILILDVTILHPKGILLKALYKEVIGWILIDKQEQYTPWTRFVLITDDQLISSIDFK